MLSNLVLGIKIDYRRFAVIFGLVSFVLFISIFNLNPDKKSVTYMAATALLMAFWWITEALPLSVTALLPVILFPVLGIMNGKAVSSQYFNHIIFLFMGGFFMAIAMEKWNLHKRIAVKILLFFGTNQTKILFGFMLASAFLSMFISNTAAAMMMTPIVLAVVTELEEIFTKEKVKKISTGFFLGIAYSTSIGGIATLVGTPPNLSFVRIFDITFAEGPDITFAKWFFFALPISAVMFFFVWGFLSYLFFSKKNGVTIKKEIFENELKNLGKTSYEEKIVFVLFILLAFLWIFRSPIDIGTLTIPGFSSFFKNPDYINDGTVAIFMAFLLFIISSKDKKSKLLDINSIQKLPWHIIILFGGGFALAAGFKESGLAYWCAEQLKAAEGLPPVVIVFFLCLFITFLTELTSNTATSEILLPIIAALSVAVKINPLFFMVPAAISCSLAFMLPVATPPNAVIFGSGRVSILDMAKTGFFINLGGIFIVIAAAYFIIVPVLGIDLLSFPDWAVMK
ncbi:MAG: SLC13 family permease [Spirochaetia bacterium]|nr:SLC13 family permease [Spirochaetia bacterium]